MESWTNKDPASASEWLSSLPSGASKDAAITVFVKAHRGAAHADEALAWAVTMQDPEHRQTLLVDLFSTWQIKPELIEKGLANPNLDPGDAFAIHEAARRDFQEPTHRSESAEDLRFDSDPFGND